MLLFDLHTVLLVGQASQPKTHAADQMHVVPVKADSSSSLCKKHEAGKKCRALVRRKHQSVVTASQRLPRAGAVDVVVDIEHLDTIDLMSVSLLGERVRRLQGLVREQAVETHAEVLEAVAHRQELLFGSKLLLMNVRDGAWPWDSELLMGV